MSANRRANAVLFGFDFQINAAIVLMLDNITSLRSLKLEGNYEDIEIELDGNEYILAQAKSVVKGSSDFNNVLNNLEKALISLSEGAEGVANKQLNVRQLIYITNSVRPTGSEEDRDAFHGESRKRYYDLPEPLQAKIYKYVSKIDKPLDLNKFMIQTLIFETDSEKERYKDILHNVELFIGSLKLNASGLANQLMKVWQNSIFNNGSKTDVTIQLSKKDIVWPILVVATDIERLDHDFDELFDVDVYNEIVHRYHNIIDDRCERCEFFIKVLCDYTNYQSTKKPMEKCKDFIFHNWRNYISDFSMDADEELTQHLIYVVLYTVIKNRLLIDRVKRQVNL